MAERHFGVVDVPQLGQIGQAASSAELQRIAADRRRNGKGSAFASDVTRQANKSADSTSSADATPEAPQPLRRKSDLSALAAAVLRGLGEFINKPSGHAPGGLAGALGFQAQRIAQETPVEPNADERSVAVNAYREAGRRGQITSGPDQRVDFEV